MWDGMENGERKSLSTHVPFKSAIKKFVPITDSILKVYCRLKPSNRNREGNAIFEKEGNNLLVEGSYGKRSYNFTKVFDGHSTNKDLYRDVLAGAVQEFLTKGIVI